MSVDPTPSFAVAPSPDRLEIVPMTEAAVDAILSIERQSFPDPWPRRFFIEEISKSQPAYARVVLLDEQVVGYLVAWFVLDEIHLGNLAVHPEYRRRGIARALVEHLVERADRRGASVITLEVRAGNRAAVALYSRYHFQPVGLRRGYYGGREDAIVMVREFAPGGATAAGGRPGPAGVRGAPKRRAR
jgi:ribosomal-protein-alanine N-acetyltransferase